MFITTKIAFIFKQLTAVQIYDFHIFTTVYSPLHGFIWKQHSDQLSVGLLAQWVEHCTGIAEVMGSNSVQAWIFFRPSFRYYLSSVHYSEDRFHIHVFSRSWNIWLPYIHNRLFVCLSVCQSFYMSICLSVYVSLNRSIYQSIYISIYLSIVLYIHLSVYLPFDRPICLSIYLSVHTSIYLSGYISISLYICLSIDLSICRCVYLSIYLPTCLSIYLSSICLSTYLSIFLSIYLSLSVCIFIYLSIYLLIQIYVCLYVCLYAIVSFVLGIIKMLATRRLKTFILYFLLYIKSSRGVLLAIYLVVTQFL